MGQPSFFESQPHKVRALLDALGRGIPVKQACAVAGVSYGWYRNAYWKGAKGEKPYAEFFGDVKNAKASAVDFYVQCLQRNAQSGDATSAIFMLKALAPKTFNRPPPQKVEISHKQASATPEETLRVAEAFVARQRGRSAA